MPKTVDFNPFVDDPVDVAIRREGITDPTAQAYVKSLYQQESSSGQNTKTSNQGAHGPMQVTEGAFKDSGVKGDLNDTMDSTHAGVRYAMLWLKAANGDVRLAAAGYYGGPGGQAKAANGVAVRDPNNPKAPTTLQYADQVAKRAGGTPVKGKVVDFDPFADEAPPTPQGGASQIPNENAGAGPTVLPDEQPGILSRALAAAKGAGKQLVSEASTTEGWKRAGNAALNTVLDAPNAVVTASGKLYAPWVGAVQDLVGGDKLGTNNARIQQGIDQFGQDTARDPNSLGYKGTQLTTQIAGTAGPLNRATAAMAGPGASTIRRVAADVGANAAFSGGQSALEGKGITDIMADAAMGGAVPALPTASPALWAVRRPPCPRGGNSSRRAVGSPALGRYSVARWRASSVASAIPRFSGEPLASAARRARSTTRPSPSARRMSTGRWRARPTGSRPRARTPLPMRSLR